MFNHKTFTADHVHSTCSKRTKVLAFKSSQFLQACVCVEIETQRVMVRIKVLFYVMHCLAQNLGLCNDEQPTPSSSQALAKCEDLMMLLKT